jgi:hypothetical protein
MITAHRFGDMLAEAQGASPSERNPRQVRGSSRRGAKVALAALHRAGEHGLPRSVLVAIVMHVGGCSEDAAEQQLRLYVRPEVTVWSPAGSERGRGTKRESQIWQLY